MQHLIPIERIRNVIFVLRGKRVILDADLSDLYGVTTKRLNEQVKRNKDRFPPDFMFQLTSKEKAEVVAICDHLSQLKFSPALPYAFTEHGTVMLANVLKSVKATQVSIQIVRTFIYLREMLATHRDLSRKLIRLERKYDARFQVVFDAIRKLMAPPIKPRRKIGFTR